MNVNGKLIELNMKFEVEILKKTFLVKLTKIIFTPKKNHFLQCNAEM